MKQVLNKYQTYELTDEELVQGMILAPLQRAILSTMLVQVMEQKLALEPDPDNNPIQYWQQEAFYRGQLQLINTLLEGDTEAQQHARESEASELVEQTKLF